MNAHQIKKNLTLCKYIIENIDSSITSAWGLNEEQQAALIFTARIFAAIQKLDKHDDISHTLYNILKPHLNLLNESLALLGNLSMEQKLTHAISLFQLNQLG